MTTERKKKLAVRMREPLFADNWREIIARIAGSSFCTGHNDRGWIADIDWVLKNGANYIKVLEGKYDDATRGKRGNGRSDPTESQFGTHLATDTDLERLEAQGL